MLVELFVRGRVTDHHVALKNMFGGED